MINLIAAEGGHAGRGPSIPELFAEKGILTELKTLLQPHGHQLIACAMTVDQLELVLEIKFSGHEHPAMVAFKLSRLIPAVKKGAAFACAQMYGSILKALKP